MNWDVWQRFVLTHGVLSLEAESHLTKRSVRRAVSSEPGMPEGATQAYVYTCYVSADAPAGALQAAGLNLSALLNPYGQPYFVFNGTATCIPEAIGERLP